MKYRPGLPEHNSNISHEHPLKEFFVLVAGVTGIIVLLFILLGFLIDTSIEYIDPEVEATLFGMVVSQDAEPASEREQELQQLINQLGSCVDIGYPINVQISESDEVNAYAMPGGRVVVLSGLLDKVETENGRAFILAHELGHFQNRDHLRSMGRTLVVLAISVVLTGADSDMSALVTPVHTFKVAQFSQERESAADATALKALNCHYGHVGDATEFFELLVEPDERLDWSLTHYFTSHPEAQQRIDDLQALAAELGYKNHDLHK
jgi:Zn-dependent protease with chaperone function